jgi:hypothetical protein
LSKLKFSTASRFCRATRNEREVVRDATWDRGEGRPGDFGLKFPFRREPDDDRRSDDRRPYFQHDERDGRSGDRRGMGGLAGRGRMGGGGGLNGGMKRVRQETEPEWMNESISLSDTIELRYGWASLNKAVLIASITNPHTRFASRLCSGSTIFADENVDMQNMLPLRSTIRFCS